MVVIGFKRNAAPHGSAVRVMANYGAVWVDVHLMFAGHPAPSRREAIRAVQAAPYGRSYSCSINGGCFEQTRLEAPPYIKK